ncbi:hypothetical protein TFUB20_00724 [Tannerella forsythia]|uniref:Uncharacterized protein n=1 Tax=Tannerella forsythia TaxID=28112 RepID=A0A1D3UH51_TANFO|nr:hypothetical protein TFUB20_00724 [Tannerella forsythia]
MVALFLFLFLLLSVKNKSIMLHLFIHRYYRHFLLIAARSSVSNSNFKAQLLQSFAYFGGVHK